MYSSSSSSSSSSFSPTVIEKKRRKKESTKDDADFEQFAFLPDTKSSESSSEEKKDVAATTKEKRISPTAMAVKDVSVHTRKAIWTSIYGDTRQARCFLCRFNDVGWQAFSFDLAHIVPRASGGNNAASWNRFATCATCNQKVANNTNLLDFVQQNYPDRLISVVLNLWERFRAAEPCVARHYFVGETEDAQVCLERFVRTMYGRHGIERGKRYFRRLLPDYDDPQQPGRITDDAVYATMRYFDAAVNAKRTLRRQIYTVAKEIDSLQQTTNRLLAEKHEFERRLASADKELKRLSTTTIITAADASVAACSSTIKQN